MESLHRRQHEYRQASGTSGKNEEIRSQSLKHVQIVGSSTGMAANYRAAGLARSRAEFISKLGIVLEEADETLFWLEMLAESGVMKAEKLTNLTSEAKELVAIFAASRTTAKS